MFIRLFFPFLLCLQTAAYANSDYFNELIVNAQQKQLADRPEWHALLHYKPNLLLPGVTSQVDGDTFFNAPDGKINPVAELEATLLAFFSTEDLSANVQHKQCLFAARYHWLKQQLNFDPMRLPERECLQFKRWHAAMEPAGLTLIFPSAYLNNPASMFGHTFLRIDAKSQNDQTRLLAYTISYAAGTNEKNGIIFAMKGIFGGYPGLFSVLPYYMKVKEYSQLENRDIWEYQLNFNAEEIDQLLRHVWELRHTYFDYYFFDENCAYHLLSLLDVARPGLNLTQQIRLWAIPTDTVRIAVETENLLNKVVYRPALSTQLDYQLSLFDDKQHNILTEFVEEDISTNDARLSVLPNDQRLNILNAAYNLIEYNRLTEENPDDFSTKQLSILQARSQLNTENDVFTVPTPTIRPEQGHGTGRFSLGLGKEKHASFTSLSFRPAYHDLLDPAEGYSPGAELKFASLELRYFNQSNKLKLEDLTLLGIQSISPRNRFLKPISWSMNLGFKRKQMTTKEDFVVARASGGPGLTYALHRNVLVYGLAEGIIEAGKKLKEDYATGAGLNSGFLANLSPRWSMLIAANANWYFLGHEHSQTDINWEQRISLSRQTSLRFKVSRRQQFDYNWTGASLSWQQYF